MKLLVGLGNPGPQYTNTRHNAGFMVVDRLVAEGARGAVAKARFQAVTVEATIAGEQCLLIKPTTFMNKSGQSVGEALRFFKLEASTDLLVIVDDLYLPTGTVRLRPSGGTAGHNGLANIQQLLGTEVYPRLRVGVGLQPSGGKPALMDQADFVLGRFNAEEKPALESSITRAAEAVKTFVAKGVAAAMNSLGPEPPDKRREGQPPGASAKPPVSKPQSIPPTP